MHWADIHTGQVSALAAVPSARTSASAGIAITNRFMVSLP